MNITSVRTVASVLAAVGSLIAASAYAQQSTSAATSNPKWCSEVPVSPAPPMFEPRYGNWAATRKRCLKTKNGFLCGERCLAAKELWNLKKAGLLDKPNTFPTPSDKLQGPFPLPDGGSWYIMPTHPTPTPSNSGSDAADPLSAALDSLSPPPGPFSNYPGQDLNAITDGLNVPDPAADVSGLQNVEFTPGTVNGGLYIWGEPALPIQTPPTPQIVRDVDFWCGSNDVTGNPLPGCAKGTNGNNLELFGPFSDTQIGFDQRTAQWIAVQKVAADPITGDNWVFFAVSKNWDATATWNKWSIPACRSNPLYKNVDQPFLGWSDTFAVVDLTCANSDSSVFGSDEILVMDYQSSLGVVSSTITSSDSFQGAIVAPCAKMVPSRDEDESLDDSYLLASIVPMSPIQNQSPNCAPVSNNTAPYVVEYKLAHNATTNTASLVGTKSGSKCTAGTSGCLPISTSSQWGLTPPVYELGIADQLGCGGNPSCEIDLRTARIKAVQIRSTAISGVSTPILVGGFATGILTGATGPQSQNLWFIQNPSSGKWPVHFSLSGNSQWYAFPTIANDEDQDFYFGGTLFSSTSLPATIWDAYTGVSTPVFKGQNLIETSSNEYMGNPPDQPAWGDFSTMIYDPNATAPGGLGSWWSVEETTKGGADQTTNWYALADPNPLPLFNGYSIPTGADNTIGENECGGGSAPYASWTIPLPQTPNTATCLLRKLRPDRT